MNNLKQALFFGISVLMLFSLGATGNQDQAETGSNEPIELSIMLASADETRKAINDRIIAGLEDNFPGVVFEIDEAQDYDDKARTMNATGDLPDVFFLDSREYQLPLINAGSVLDLKPYIEGDGFADKYKLKTVIAPHSDGGVYSLQSGADAYFASTLFYNKEIFARYEVEVPVTFDEFVAACEVFKKNGVTPITSSLTDAWAAKSVILPSLIAAEDPSVIEKIVNLEADFSSNPAVLAAVENLSILAKNGYFLEGALNTDYGSSQALFTGKEAAMYAMFSWAAGDLASDPSFDIMSWPQTNPDVNMDDVVTLWGSSYSGYLVNSNPVSKDIAVKVAEYCAMTEAEYFNEVNKMPTSLDTGIEISDISEIVQKSLNRIDNAEVVLPSYILYSFSPKGNTKLSEILSLVLIGAEDAQGFSKNYAEDWAESVEYLSGN